MRTTDTQIPGLEPDTTRPAPRDLSGGLRDQDLQIRVAHAGSWSFFHGWIDWQRLGEGERTELEQLLRKAITTHRPRF